MPKRNFGIGRHVPCTCGRLPQIASHYCLAAAVIGGIAFATGLLALWRF